MMKVIGLTGGIGSGKSTVSQFLAELGATILDADEVGHEALKPGTEVWERVVNEFGKGIVDASGGIDRARLGELVFNNHDARERLNNIMHPAIYSMVNARLEEYRRQGVNIAVLEVPLLLEVGWTSLVDEIWVTVAPEAVVLKRLLERTGLTEHEAKARINAQLSNEERIKHADVVIDTDCSLDELKAKVAGLWLRLQAQNGTTTV
jgi:dephospho-CoA kinase